MATTAKRELRDTTVAAKMTATEAAEVYKVAAQLDMTPSEFLRASAIVSMALEGNRLALGLIGRGVAASIWRTVEKSSRAAAAAL